jgi:hypothetical protein
MISTTALWKEFDESKRLVQKSAESTEMERFEVFAGRVRLAGRFRRGGKQAPWGSDRWTTTVPVQ